MTGNNPILSYCMLPVTEPIFCEGFQVSTRLCSEKTAWIAVVAASLTLEYWSQRYCLYYSELKLRCLLPCSVVGNFMFGCTGASSGPAAISIVISHAVWLVLVVGSGWVSPVSSSRTNSVRPIWSCLDTIFFTCRSFNLPSLRLVVWVWYWLTLNVSCFAIFDRYLISQFYFDLVEII